MSLHSVVVFVSNPFGFGPTGKTIALMEELRKVWEGKIVYATGTMCQETLPNYLKNKITIETINERDEGSLKRVFLKYGNPFVVCTLNRLAVKTAKFMELRGIFVDSLAWMWKEIPEEYLLADTYYCFDLFNIRDKIPDRNNIKIISPVFGRLPKHKGPKESFTLIHIGGFNNPFQDKLSFDYLNLLVESLNSVKSINEIIVTGGRDAINYLAKKTRRDNHKFQTLGRNVFLNCLSLTSHFITTSGLTATLEAFALKAPTSFIPPTNLSQWKILKLLVANGCANSKIEWNDICRKTINFNDYSEKEAVPQFHKLAERVSSHKGYRLKFVKLVSKIIMNIPECSAQSAFIESAGINGSETIVNDMLPYLEK